MKNSLKKTQHQLALFFSLLSSGLIIFITLLIILLVKAEIDYQAKSTLETALKSVIQDYNANNLQERSSLYQKSNTASLNADISLSPSSGNANKETLSNINDESEKNKSNLTDLQNIKNVYSRVILPNGGILFTSDLYDQTFIDPKNEGFSIIDQGNICIYNINSKIASGTNTGSIVQVGQFCPFNYEQQKALFKKILLVTLAVLFLTYLMGFIAAKWLLKPIEKSLAQTRQFVENCYHELLTPITVAMTTIDAGEKTKDYENTLGSLKEDLKNIYNSLYSLSKNALLENQKANIHETNLVQVLEDLTKDQKEKFDLKNLEKKVLKNIEPTTAKLIFSNLISNAVKYSKSGTRVGISLNKKGFEIQNELNSSNEVDMKKFFKRNYRGVNSKNIPGNGLGLSIVKELCESQGWKVKAKQKEKLVIIQVIF
jgi:two-component sensor histidine kinase